MSDSNQSHFTGNRFLSFSLGNEDYAIPLLCVKEVIAVPEVTPIPFTPSHFLGIMNLRGQVISVIDLRTKFGIKPQNTAENAVIICDLAPICLGVVVDSIDSVLTPAEGDLSGKPDIHGSKIADYITNVYRRKDKRLVLLLDIARVLSVEDMHAIKNTVPLKKAA
ncbi:chemotaxis protein CheW [Bdellovibrionota bacterium FG-1]